MRVDLTFQPKPNALALLAQIRRGAKREVNSLLASERTVGQVKLCWSQRKFPRRFTGRNEAAPPCFPLPALPIIQEMLFAGGNNDRAPRNLAENEAMPLTLFAETLPVELEALDACDRPLSRVPALLRQLDGEMATLTLPDGQTFVPCLHWGTRVRFRVEDGPRSCEVWGTVVAHNLTRSGWTNPPARQADPLGTRSEAPSQLRAETRANDPAEAGDVEPRQISVRLHDCRPVSQRRQFPRSRARLALRYQILETEDSPSPTVHETQAALASQDAAEIAGDSTPTWLPGVALDLGAGGLRLRAACPPCQPTLVVVAFILPAAADSAARDFALRARVLRMQASARRTDFIEMALKFEPLAVADGLALAAFLTNG